MVYTYYIMKIETRDGTKSIKTPATFALLVDMAHFCGARLSQPTGLTLVFQLEPSSLRAGFYSSTKNIIAVFPTGRSIKDMAYTLLHEFGHADHWDGWDCSDWSTEEREGYANNVRDEYWPEFSAEMWYREEL